MADLAVVSPLMKPVEWQGQIYYLSQYFHRQYLANSPHGGKYQQHAHFLRLLRGMEAYAIYLEEDDIIELEWNAIKTIKSEAIPIWDCWKPLFQATGYQPITLLNATAQLALANHLDDELSKQIAVAANTLAARHEAGADLLEQYPELKAIAEIGRSVMALAATTAELRNELATTRQEVQANAVRIEATAAQIVCVEAKADLAEAKADSAVQNQNFWTIAEYVQYHDLRHQCPESAYTEASRHMQGYCKRERLNYRDPNILPRRIPVGDKHWEREWGFHTSVYEAAFLPWLLRRQGQQPLGLV